MISVSSAYKTAIKETPKAIREKIVFTLTGGDVLTVTNANIWQGGLEIEDAVSSEGIFEIGSTHVGRMSVSLMDTDRTEYQNVDFSISSEGHLMMNGEQVTYYDVYANTHFEDASVVVWLAIEGQDYVQKGVYNVVKCERHSGIIDITAYDNMNKLAIPYETSLTYPSTFAQVLREACLTCLGTEPMSLTFDGYDTAISKALVMDGLTYREVVGYIAQACGYNVRCNTDGRLEFVRYNLSGFETEGAYHEIDSIYSLSHSYYEVVITGAKTYVTTQTDTTDPDTGEVETSEVMTMYSAGTDDYQIVIKDNPFITTTNAQAVVNRIFANFGGVAFYIGAVTHSSDFTIEASDIAVITDRSGATYNFLVSSTTFSTGDAQSTNSYAEEPASKLTAQASEIGRVATEVRQALLNAKNAQNKGNYAASVANNTNQYFWHTETGTDTGAHITEIPQEDFLDTPTGGNLLARSNGIAVRMGMTELSQFTSNAVNFLDGAGNSASNVVASFGGNQSIIGKTDNSHLELDYRSIKAIDSLGRTYFYISDLRDSSGYATIIDRFATNLTDGTYRLSMLASNIVSVTLDDVETQNYSYDSSYGIVTVDPTGMTGDEIILVTYTTTSMAAKAYTLGIRHLTATVGGMSTAFGYLCEASGSLSIAAGKSTHATGMQSIATGTGSTASGAQSFAGGYESQADTENSIAYGFRAIAGAKNSFAFGQCVSSVDANSTVVGRYNDGANTGLFSVGNGTSNSNRSTAFYVEQSGQCVAKSLWSLGVIKANAVRKYEPTFESGETGVAYHCAVSAGLCSLSYQGQGKAHSAGTLLFTLPADARPSSQVYAPFVKMSGGAVGNIVIGTDGKVKVDQISNTSNTGRIYFNCSFPVV